MRSNPDEQDNTLRPLVALSRSRKVNNFSQFAEAASLLTVEKLQRFYDDEKANAPRRMEAGKKYLVGHNGIPSTGKYTNRDEEHLAIAIFNHYNPKYSESELYLCSEERLMVLDYQFPLKAYQADEGVGKVDLFCVDYSKRVCIVELKISRSSPDTPLRGVIEGLSYAAIVQANFNLKFPFLKTTNIL